MNKFYEDSENEEDDEDEHTLQYKVKYLPRLRTF